MTTTFTDPHRWPPPARWVPSGLDAPSPPPPAGSSRRRRIAGVVVALALIVASTFLDPAGWLALPLLFVIVVPFEKMFPRHRGQRLRRPGAGTDIAYALATPALNTVAVGIAIAVGVLSLAWLPGLAIRPLVAMVPASLLPFVGIALFDLTSYWVHRWAHEVPLLWRFHAIHHSPQHMDWVSGFRNHPAEGAILAPPFFFLIAAGFNATFTGMLAIVQIFFGLFLHANVRWRFRVFDRIFVTPEFHHWHHSNERAAHRTNYSIFLPLWDIVFGTYRMPRTERPSVYGVDDPIPEGMMAQLWWPVRSIGSPLRWLMTTVRHPWQATRRGFRLTGTVVRDVWRSTRRPTRSAACLRRSNAR